MQLSVREVAEMFGVSERHVVRWIEREGLPAYRIYDQYRCNRAELVEWAMARQVPPQLLAESGAALESLSAALRAGGVWRCTADTSPTPLRHQRGDGDTLWRALLERLDLPESVDLLLDVLRAQARLRPLAVEDGVVRPHVNTPLLLNVPAPMVALGLFEPPAPVRALWLVIGRTLTEHWHLVAKISFALREPAFSKVIMSHSPSDLIISEAQRIDALFSEGRA
jgi:PTS system nitrogen regulatory IIA component